MSQLTRKQRKALERYASTEISIEELRESLQGVLEFDFKDQERRLTTHYGTPEPGVRIEMRHIRNAMDRHARGDLTTEELADWAAMLLLNDAYDWEGPDEDEIADLLNDLSTLTLKPRSGPG